MADLVLSWNSSRRAEKNSKTISAMTANAHFKTENWQPNIGKAYYHFANLLAAYFHSNELVK
jgi:hypothetical protein